MTEILFCPKCECPLQHLPGDPIMFHALDAHNETCHKETE